MCKWWSRICGWYHYFKQLWTTFQFVCVAFKPEMQYFIITLPACQYFLLLAVTICIQSTMLVNGRHRCEFFHRKEIHMLVICQCGKIHWVRQVEHQNFLHCVVAHQHLTVPALVKPWVKAAAGHADRRLVNLKWGGGPITPSWLPLGRRLAALSTEWSIWNGSDQSAVE